MLSTPTVDERKVTTNAGFRQKITGMNAAVVTDEGGKIVTAV
jgi:hypothetical protein